MSIDGFYGSQIGIGSTGKKKPDARNRNTVKQSLREEENIPFFEEMKKGAEKIPRKQEKKQDHFIGVLYTVIQEEKEKGEKKITSTNR